MKFLDMIKIDRIIPALESTDKEGVINEMLQTFGFDEKQFKTNSGLVLEREAKGTTGMGEGIASPHTNVSDVTEIMGAVGRSEAGVDFQALDGQPVHLVFMVLSPADQKEAHIEGIKYISKKMRNAIYKRFLMEVKGKREIRNVLKEIDEKDTEG